MQYFLSYLSLSYQFVLSSRNKSKWCTIIRLQHCTGCWKLSQQWHLHRNDCGNLFWMMIIWVILVTSGHWSGWHWLVSFVSFMTSSNLQWWLWNIVMCDRYDMMRDASRNHNISRPISSRKIKLVLAELEWLCRTLFAEGGQIGSQDPSATRVFPGCNIMTGCCDTAQPTGSGVMVTVRRQTSAARVSPGVESVMAQMLMIDPILSVHVYCIFIWCYDYV